MRTQPSTHWAPVPAEVVPSYAVPPQAVPSDARRRGEPPLAERIIRQIEAVDAWNTARRLRESLLEAACTSRLDREAAKRQTDALRRTQQAIAACAAGELARDPGPLMHPTATAVIAHRHDWFAERVAALLEARGVTVVACTANGADALGAVVAEQPDVVLVGERLVMVPGDVLLAEARLFAPATVRAVQASDAQHSGAWTTRADAVFSTNQRPGDVADALSALCRAPAAEHAEA